MEDKVTKVQAAKGRGRTFQNVESFHHPKEGGGEAKAIKKKKKQRRGKREVLARASNEGVKEEWVKRRGEHETKVKRPVTASCIKWES